MSRLKDLPSGVTRVLFLATALFWAVQLSLYVLAGLPLPDTILLSTLLIAMPPLAIAQVPLVRETLIQRLPAYWSTIATLGILGTISWLVGTRTDGLAAIGLTLLPPVPFIAWTFGLTAAGLGIIVVFRQIAIALRLHESPLLRSLLLRSTEERGVFAILSVAAGVSEEVAYRGYSIPVLIPIVGSVGALLVTSSVLGVLHVYQGTLGIFRTAAMGATLAGGFLLSGSLLPAIISHTAIGLLAGIFIADKLLLPRDSTGVGNGDQPLQES